MEGKDQPRSGIGIALVAVAGAGPAGLATAIFAARAIDPESPLAGAAAPDADLFGRLYEASPGVDAVDELGLKVGAEATAMFKASNVLLGVPA